MYVCVRYHHDIIYFIYICVYMCIRNKSRKSLTNDWTLKSQKGNLMPVIYYRHSWVDMLNCIFYRSMMIFHVLNGYNKRNNKEHRQIVSDFSFLYIFIHIDVWCTPYLKCIYIWIYFCECCYEREKPIGLHSPVGSFRDWVWWLFALWLSIVRACESSSKYHCKSFYV